MKIFLTILVFIISVPLFGQRDTILKISDFNEDGYIDTLKSYYDGGSGFGGRYVKIANGKSDEIYEINSSGCFCEIRSTILVPPVLLESKNISFLEAIKNQLLPKRQNTADPSLDWIIKGSFHHQELDSNIYFDLIIDPQTPWTEKKMEIQENYYMEIKNDSLGKVYSTPYETPDWYVKGEGKGFLIYNSNQHGNNPGTEFLLSDSNSLYQVYRTKHGVVVQKGNLHKWVFISDYPLTDAPEKLRWESIGKVILMDHYLFIQQKLTLDNASHLYMLDIETGTCGRFNQYMFDSDGKDVLFRLEAKKIILLQDDNSLLLPLDNVIQELTKQSLPRN